MDKIDKDFGKGSVMMMSDKGVVEQEVISTGSIGLDMALRHRRFTKRKGCRNLRTGKFW